MKKENNPEKSDKIIKNLTKPGGKTRSIKKQAPTNSLLTSNTKKINKKISQEIDIKQISNYHIFESPQVKRLAKKIQDLETRLSDLEKRIDKLDNS